MMMLGGNRVYEMYVSPKGPKLNTDAWVAFLGMLTGSQHCAASLYSTFYSMTPTASPLLGGGRYYQLHSTDQEMKAPRSEVTVPVNGQAKMRV